MKHSYLYILLFIGVLLSICSSCVNEFAFPADGAKPMLVLNAFINTDSTNNILYLNYTGRESIGDVSEATVEVRVNGVLVETAQQQAIVDNGFNRKQSSFLITSKFNPGESVRIDAWTPQTGHHAWVEEIILPAPLPIVNIDTMTVNISYPQEYTNRLMKFRITIQDRPNEKNYYRLILERQYRLVAQLYNDDKEYIKDTTMIRKTFTTYNNEDVILTDGNPSIGNDDNDVFDKVINYYNVFDDNRFSGQECTLNIYKGSDTPPRLGQYFKVLENELTCYVRLLHISAITFNYYQALNVFDSDIYDSMLMEPIIYASNVNGGTGMVNFSTETSVKMDLPPNHFEVDYLYW